MKKIIFRFDKQTVWLALDNYLFSFFFKYRISAWCGFRNLGFRSKPVAQLGNRLEIVPKGLKSGLELCAGCGSQLQFF